MGDWSHRHSTIAKIEYPLSCAERGMTRMYQGLAAMDPMLTSLAEPRAVQDVSSGGPPAVSISPHGLQIGFESLKQNVRE